MTLRPIALLAAACLAGGSAACSRDADAAAESTTRADGGEVAPGQPARDDADALLALLALLPASSDPAVRAGRAALEIDAPWRAAAALAPALADPARRTPAVALLAAAAAAEREEWATVTQLAGALPDSAGRGFAPLLLARAALARGTAGARTALDAARRSAAHAPDATERGVRLALAARAMDRLAGAAEDVDSARTGASVALADSAREAYRAAAALLPSVADWLALRSAEVTRDSAGRARVYAGLRLGAARERTAGSEATARERAGDRLGAAAAYAAAGRRVKLLSLRLAAAGARGDAAARAAVRDSLVRVVVAQAGTAEARAAVELLDLAFPGGVTPAEELSVARSATASGPAARAVVGFQRALAASLGTPRDRYSYATLLGRAGRTAEASAEFARVRAAGGTLAGDAAYQRARLLMRGNGAGARAALREVVEAFPADTEAATSALALLSDLTVDDGNDAEARALLLRLAGQYPASVRTPRARFDAAIIALAAGDARTAATELDALRGVGVDSTSREEVVAATYWAGRAAQAAGDAARARARWRELTARVPASYYAMLAARRLGEAPWSPTGGATVAPADPTVTAAVERIAVLERIGFDPEAGWERDGLVRWADSSAARMVVVAQALRDAGATSAGMRLARRAVDRGGQPAVAAYRSLYPWPWEPLLREAATARDLDPALAAAVIRQESNFTPSAVSPAGAVGLMQLMPPVGRSLWDALGAQRAGIPWSPALLRQPDVNVALGARHLASALRQYPDIAFALAAYNAGGTPVARWRKRPGTADPELFVERIPYDETRDYVRIVSRNQAFYRRIYER